MMKATRCRLISDRFPTETLVQLLQGRASALRRAEAAGTIVFFEESVVGVASAVVGSGTCVHFVFSNDLFVGIVTVLVVV